MTAAISTKPLPGLMLSMERVAVLGISVAIALIYSNTPTVAVQFHGLPAALNYVAPAILAGVAALAIIRDHQLIRLTAAAPWIGLFMATGFIGALCARNPGAAIDELVSMLIEGVVLYLVVVNSVRTPQMLHAALWAIVGAATFMSLVVIVQYATGSFDQNYGGFGQLGSLIGEDSPDNEARLAGSIGEVNRFAQILAMALPVALVKARSSTTSSLRVCAGLGALAMLGGCAVTFSRGVLIGLVPVVLIALALGYLKARALLTGALVGTLLILAIPSYRERVASLAEVVVLAASSDGLRSSDGAVRGRFASVGASLLVFADHPIIGVGPGQNLMYYQQYSLRVGGKLRPYPREAHSLIPQLLADWGLLGFLGFAGAVVTVCAGLLTHTRRLRTAGNPDQHIPAALLMALVSYGGTSAFLHFSYVRYFWLMLGLAAAATMFNSGKGSDFTDQQPNSKRSSYE